MCNMPTNPVLNVTDTYVERTQSTFKLEKKGFDD